ncbi:serine hydrolase domain-containing protein [Marinicella sp. W31]|uniref:serine hydrolase domain-containing protein n=1 Tax=Marinicella sp. W31 TaxID=3023713 RepID=UPI003756DF4A
MSTIEQKLNPVKSITQPGFILRVQQDSKTVIEIASGAADIEQEAFIDANTVFHIASLSKQITAAAVTHAIMDGLLEIDDDASHWIPGLKPYKEKITIAHLIYMTSGLTEYTQVPRKNGMPWSTFHYFSVAEAIEASLSVKELQFKPGSQWQYSNINYMLLTEIVATVYKKPFSQVVKEKIFNPLNMHHSLVNDDITTIIPNRANGYTNRNRENIQMLREHAGIKTHEGEDFIQIKRNAPHYGGSGVMTNMNDWTLWQSELLNHEVFGHSFWEIMLSPKKFNHHKNNDAFGLVWGDLKGKKTLWYEGGDIDVSSYAISIPDKQLSITCFSNNPNDSCSNKVKLVMEEILLMVDQSRNPKN